MSYGSGGYYFGRMIILAICAGIKSNSCITQRYGTMVCGIAVGSSESSFGVGYVHFILASKRTAKQFMNDQKSHGFSRRRALTQFEKIICYEPSHQLIGATKVIDSVPSVGVHIFAMRAAGLADWKLWCASRRFELKKLNERHRAYSLGLGLFSGLASLRDCAKAWKFGNWRSWISMFAVSAFVVRISIVSRRR